MENSNPQGRGVTTPARTWSLALRSYLESSKADARRQCAETFRIRYQQRIRKEERGKGTEERSMSVGKGRTHSALSDSATLAWARTALHLSTDVSAIYLIPKIHPKHSCFPTISLLGASHSRDSRARSFVERPASASIMNNSPPLSCSHLYTNPNFVLSSFPPPFAPSRVEKQPTGSLTAQPHRSPPSLSLHQGPPVAICRS